MAPLPEQRYHTGISCVPCAVSMASPAEYGGHFIGWMLASVVLGKHRQIIAPGSAERPSATGSASPPGTRARTRTSARTGTGADSAWFLACRKLDSACRELLLAEVRRPATLAAVPQGRSRSLLRSEWLAKW